MSVVLRRDWVGTGEVNESQLHSTKIGMSVELNRKGKIKDITQEQGFLCSSFCHPPTYDVTHFLSGAVAVGDPQLQMGFLHDAGRLHQLCSAHYERGPRIPGAEGLELGERL